MLFRPRRLTGEEKRQITEKHGLADACFCCGGKDGKWLCAERTHGVFHGSAARFRIAPCGDDAILTTDNGKRPMADAWRCRKIILYCDKQVRRAGADRFQATRTVLFRRISAAGQQAESGGVRRLFKSENKIDARRGRGVRCARCAGYRVPSFAGCALPPRGRSRKTEKCRGRSLKGRPRHFIYSDHIPLYCCRIRSLSAGIVVEITLHQHDRSSLVARSAGQVAQRADEIGQLARRGALGHHLSHKIGVLLADAVGYGLPERLAR